MKKHHLIIFDMDGTFIDSRIFHASVFEKFFAKYGHPVSFNQCYDAVGLTVKSVFDTVGIQEADQMDYFHKLAKFYERDAKSLLPKSRLFEDARAVFCELKRQGVLLALVSNSLHEVVAMFLQYHALTDIFDDIEGADPESFTKHARCQRIQARLGIVSEYILCVGDTESDMALANDLGYDSCFAKTPLGWYQDANYIEQKYLPTYSLTSYAEWLEHLKGVH